MLERLTCTLGVDLTEGGLVALDLLVLLDDVLVVLLFGDLGLALVTPELIYECFRALQPFDHARVIITQLCIRLPQSVDLLVARL